MITTLLNEVDEYQEVIKGMDLEINRRIQTERVNAALIREKITDLEVEGRRKKDWRKVTLISSVVILVETLLLVN